jgi:hypothetical protein
MTSYRQGTEFGTIQIADFDPTTGDGVSGGTPNLLLIRTDIPSLYSFQGPDDTDWNLIGIGSDSLSYLTAVRIQAKWCIAASTSYNDSTWPGSSNPYGYSHMATDNNLDSLVALIPLSISASQDQVNEFMNQLRGWEIGHCYQVGSLTVDGAHIAVDSFDADALEATPQATDSSSCITLINNMATAIVTHGWTDTDNLGQHFHDDQTPQGGGDISGGRFFVLPVAPPVTLADQISDANAIQQSMIIHFENAVPLANIP